MRLPWLYQVKRGEVLSSGFVITPAQPPALAVSPDGQHPPSQSGAEVPAHGTRVIYCVQLGPSALRLAIADLVGPDKPMVKSLLSLRRRLASIPAGLDS